MNRMRSAAILAMTLAGFVAVSPGSPPSGQARPVVSARITGVEAAAGSQSGRVSILARCAPGWDSNAVAQRLILRQDPTVAFKNITGSDVGWACDGLDHRFTVDLTADGPWRAGGAQASFDATVTDGTNWAADSARKSIRIR
jgi:hypothetical protein